MAGICNDRHYDVRVMSVSEEDYIRSAETQEYCSIWLVRHPSHVHTGEGRIADIMRLIV